MILQSCPTDTYGNYIIKSEGTLWPVVHGRDMIMVTDIYTKAIVT
jgi:hypothetical protein